MSGQMSVSHASKPVQRYKIFSRFASFSAKKAHLIVLFSDESDKFHRSEVFFLKREMLREMFSRHLPPVKPFVYRRFSVVEGDVGDVAALVID